jgi:hypothetical protein
MMLSSNSLKKPPISEYFSVFSRRISTEKTTCSPPPKPNEISMCAIAGTVQ